MNLQYPSLIPRHKVMTLPNTSRHILHIQAWGGEIKWKIDEAVERPTHGIPYRPILAIVVAGTRYDSVSNKITGSEAMVDG